MVAVGISPKSFGYYYFNNQEKKGVDFLNNLPDAETTRRMEHVILPGLTDKTAWLISMETIKLNYGSDLLLTVDYNRYRYLQILYVYGRFARALENKDPKIAQYRVEFDELASKLTLWEKMVYLTMLRIATLGTRLVPLGLRYKTDWHNSRQNKQDPSVLIPNRTIVLIKISLRCSNRLTRRGIVLNWIIYPPAK